MLRKDAMKMVLKSGIVLLTGSALIALLNTVQTKEERTKRLVIKVWDEIKDDIVNTLGLKKMPKLEWDAEDGAIMSVNTSFRMTGSLFEKKIVGTDTDYIIHVNLKTLAETINLYTKHTFYTNLQLPKMIIAQVLYHECRHLWQAQGDFYLGRSHSRFEFSFNVGHGETPEETDANEFACSMAKTKKEKVLAALHKKHQEASGKYFGIDCSKEERAFIKEFTPVLRWFVGA